MTASYYGRPVIKPPEWEPLIAWYFFTGGLAGASSALALGARVLGDDVLERRAWLSAAAGILPSPPLLIADLGRPERFLNMLRMFKVTSPMSVGTWIVSTAGTSIGLATVNNLLGWFPRSAAVARVTAGALGAPLSTYTAALVAQSAVPVWHGARRELPFVFAGSAMASAGAATTITTPVRHAGPARRLTVAGAALELTAAQIMERRLGDAGTPYHEGRAGGFAKAAKALTAAGALTVAAGGRRRPLAVAGAALTLAGSVCERFAVFEAGRSSAEDPAYTVAPQRERLERRAA